MNIYHLKAHWNFQQNEQITLMCQILWNLENEYKTVTMLTYFILICQQIHSRKQCHKFHSKMLIHFKVKNFKKCSFSRESLYTNPLKLQLEYENHFSISFQFISPWIWYSMWFLRCLEIRQLCWYQASFIVKSLPTTNVDTDEWAIVTFCVFFNTTSMCVSDFFAFVLKRQKNITYKPPSNNLYFKKAKFYPWTV